MKTRWILAASVAVLFACTVWADESAKTTYPPHQVVEGDTLWDLSGGYWDDPFQWPLLWSKNPQLHNPHWIYPGDMIFLAEKEPPKPEVKVHEVRLVLEKLMPPEPEPVVEEEEEAPPVDFIKAEYYGTDKAFEFMSGRAQDYMSATKVDRLAVVKNEQAWKAWTHEGEEVEIIPSTGTAFKVGDKLTIFEDSRRISHPETGKSLGYHVRVIAHLEVTKSSNDRALAKVTDSYSEIENGFGVMDYREPVLSLIPEGSASGAKGFVVAGALQILNFTSDDVVFLDKGSEDGLKPGSLVAVPFPEGPTVAEGLATELRQMVAKAIVVSTQAQTSTAYIVECSQAVTTGSQFIASADSP